MIINPKLGSRLSRLASNTKLFLMACDAEVAQAAATMEYEQQHLVSSRSPAHAPHVPAPPPPKQLESGAGMQQVPDASQGTSSTGAGSDGSAGAISGLGDVRVAEATDGSHSGGDGDGDVRKEDLASIPDVSGDVESKADGSSSPPATTGDMEMPRMTGAPHPRRGQRLKVAPFREHRLYCPSCMRMPCAPFREHRLCCPSCMRMRCAPFESIACAVPRACVVVPGEWSYYRV